MKFEVCMWSFELSVEGASVSDDQITVVHNLSDKGGVSSKR